MAVMRQDVTRVTHLADADRLGVHDIHLIMLQDRPEENGSRTSAGACLYLRTADVVEAHAVGGRVLQIFQCHGSRLGITQ